MQNSKIYLFFFNTEPPFPVVPNTFSTKLEAIIADSSETVSGEEYFDENNNRAALFMLRGDQISKLIFDYNTEELFYVFREYYLYWCSKTCKRCTEVHRKTELKYEYFVVVHIYICSHGIYHSTKDMFVFS